MIAAYSQRIAWREHKSHGFLFSDRAGSFMPGVDYTMVGESVPMSRVLALLAFTAVQSNGTQLGGLSPVHRSTSPQSRSFSVNLRTNAFRCFTCGAAGNQLDLWCQVYRFTLFDAAVDLCNRAQIPVPWSQSSRARG
jgi:DNA primase